MAGSVKTIKTTIPKANAVPISRKVGSSVTKSVPKVPKPTSRSRTK